MNRKRAIDTETAGPSKRPRRANQNSKEVSGIAVKFFK